MREEYAVQASLSVFKEKGLSGNLSARAGGDEDKREDKKDSLRPQKSYYAHMRDAALYGSQVSGCQPNN